VRGPIIAVILGLLAGCASWPATWSPRALLSHPSSTLFERADRLVADRQYEDALEAYDQILAKYPDADEAGRARAARDVLAGLLAARARIARLSAEIRVKEAELARAREQLSAREGDLLRTRQEAERLRADLEQLKRIDIDLERRLK
jgi:hypothetical protein